MKPAIIRTLTDTFEGHAQQTETGVEYWPARDLQQLLGYTEWRNFQAVLAKARTACEVSGRAVSDHFVDVNKMVEIGSGSSRKVDDVMLTRYSRPRSRSTTRASTSCRPKGRSRRSTSSTATRCGRLCSLAAFAPRNCPRLWDAARAIKGEVARITPLRVA